MLQAEGVSSLLLESEVELTILFFLLVPSCTNTGLVLMNQIFFNLYP